MTVGLPNVKELDHGFTRSYADVEAKRRPDISNIPLVTY